MTANSGWHQPGGPGDEPDAPTQPGAGPAPYPSPSWQPGPPGAPFPFPVPPQRSPRRLPSASVLVPLVGAVVAVVAVLAAVIVLVQPADRPASAAGGDRQVGGSRSSAPSSAVPPPAPSSAPTVPTAEPAPPPAGGLSSAAVPLGTPAAVGDYEVAVTAVILDGDAIVAGANQFNDPPEGRYVIVEATATYVGSDEGNVFWDLSYVFNGTDARQYSDVDCSAVLPEDAIDAPTLNPGGSASFQVCMDVPPAAIEGGQLFIEPLVAFDHDQRVYFSIR